MTDDLFELELQEELRQMFEVDTQTYLQNYISTVLQLNTQNWKTDIQEIYRAIHTIKGGAVTVGADAILYVAIALEDLLSDLRYLNDAPSLEDGQLGQFLTEAGELLTSTISITTTGADAKREVFPTVERIEELRSIIQQQYLPEWNQQKGLHQEFAQQGFDLVILDLEMGLENLRSGQPISPDLVNIAELTLAQLREIGKNLMMASGWGQLIQEGKALLSEPSADVWLSQWPLFFKTLKACAINSGKVGASLETPDAPESETNLPPQSDSATDVNYITNVSIDLSSISTALDLFQEEILSSPDSDSQLGNVEEFNFEDLSILNIDEISSVVDSLHQNEETLNPELISSESLELLYTQNTLNFAENSSFVDDLKSVEFLSDGLELEPVIEQENLLDFNLQEIAQAVEFIEQSPEITEEGLDFDFDEVKDTSKNLEESGTSSGPQSGTSSGPPSSTLQQGRQEIVPTQSEALTSSPVQVLVKNVDADANISIPLSLSRANQTSQHLVDVLLSARMASGLYSSLTGQLTKLFSIARESVNYITRLRQIQDDYALMNDINNSVDQSGIALERYRQGYTTINRLLEISLRLSELGAEASKVTTTTNESFQSLERNILNLEQSIEATRVVPFKTLAFKARAIVRDLTNRYGKPTQLLVKGEDIELDAGIAAKLEPALLHLIRNAYDHGLESPIERKNKGKTEKGTITLALQRRGPQYLLTVSDDGEGINAAKLANIAKAKRLPLTNTETAAGLLAVLCQPGFSSSETVSEISGRGVGMDVVATQVSSLNGKMSLETQMDKGSSFKIQFPTPRLLVPCVLLHRGDRSFAIPMENVLTSTLWTNLQVQETPQSQSYSFKIFDGKTTVPGLDLLEYWFGRSSQYPISETAIGISVGGSDSASRVWLLVDDLGEQIEFLINPLPSPLVSPVGLLGVSLQIDGRLIPVIDGAALAEWLNNLATSKTVETPNSTATTILEDEPQTSQTILVVDDAALMRRRIEASLTAYGHPIQTCADGLEAWNWLQYNAAPALIITDLEMPNMDGFTLIERLRSQGAKMPILVISSRLSEEWNREAQRLGADGFLTKGFSTNELINKVNSLIEYQETSL